MVNGVSVVVCTYNGGRQLVEVLSCIEQQVFTGNIELIVVDNNSSPETAKIIEIEINKLTISARCVKEKKQGILFARVKGLYEARYDIVLMVDDDNFLSKNYVAEVFQAFQKDDTLGLVGGVGIARFETEKPWWFDHYQSSFAVGPQLKYHSLYGAGLGIRKNVYLSILENPNIEHVLVGRTGKTLLSGEDSEINFWFKLSGWKVRALDSISFEHLMKEDRMNLEFLHRLYHGFGMTRVFTRPYLDYLSNKANVIPPPSILRPLHIKRLSYLEHNLQNLKREENTIDGQDLNGLSKSLKLSNLYGEIEMIQKINWSYRKTLLTIQKNCLALHNV